MRNESTERILRRPWSIPSLSPHRPRPARRPFLALFSIGLVPASLSAPLSGATLLSTNLSTLLPPTSIALPDAGFSALRVFGALAVVIGLFLAGVWIFRNWHRMSAQRGPNQLRILESRSLGGRHALHVVGYQDQRLLLACSPQGISLVSHLPQADPNAEPHQGGASRGASRGDGMGPNFVRILQQAIQQKP